MNRASTWTRKASSHPCVAPIVQTVTSSSEKSMKIIRQTVKPADQWWIGLQAECSRCETLYQLEPTDHPRCVSGMGPEYAVMICQSCQWAVLFFRHKNPIKPASTAEKHGIFPSDKEIKCPNCGRVAAKSKFTFLHKIGKFACPSCLNINPINPPENSTHQSSPPTLPNP